MTNKLPSSESWDINRASTELWAKIYESLVKDGIKFPNNFDGVGACYGGLCTIKSFIKNTITAEVERGRKAERERCTEIVRTLHVQCGGADSEKVAEFLKTIIIKTINK